MTRVAFVLLFVACGARTGLDVPEHASDAAPDAHDAGLDAPGFDAHDAATDDTSVPPLCDFGTLVSDAFGGTVLWNGGAPVPAGHYRVTYTDGCMKYSSSQGWTVNAYANGPDTLYVTASSQQLAAAPGTVGFFVNQGAFATFDECVAANQSDAPLEFDLASPAPIGLALSDSPYTDNVAGENGRNPTYRLSSCQ